MLDKQGICASAGSACSTGSGMPSHVLKSIGLPDELSFATVRFTINEEITRQEIDYVVNCLKMILPNCGNSPRITRTFCENILKADKFRLSLMEKRVIRKTAVFE